MNRFKFSLIVFLLLGLGSGCNRKNNPLLNYPSGGTTSASLFIPQIDTNNTSTNRVFLFVVDQGGTPITDFQLGNFSILEGGDPGVPYEVGVVTDPLYIALAIDRSGSMSGSRTTAANTAAETLVNSLGASDYVSLVEFSSDVGVTVGFTTDKTALITAIQAGIPTGATAVYDAVGKCAEILQHQPGRRMMLVLTDGDDNSSSLTVPGAIDAANEKGLSAYMIGLGSDGIDFNGSALQQIADNTGGTFASSNTGSDLTTLFLTVVQRFNNLVYVKYRRRSEGTITAYLNYGSLTASATKALD